MAWGLNALNNRGQWPECLLEAAAQRLRHLRPGKRQAWTPLTTEGSGLNACSKLPRSVLGIWGLASGRLERPSQQRAVAGVPPECLLEAAAQRFRWQTRLTTEGSGLSACSKQAWTPLTTEGSGLSAWRKAREWQANKNRLHTCGGPRRRPCLGEGRGRRIYNWYIYIYIHLYLYIYI